MYIPTYCIMYEVQSTHMHVHRLSVCVCSGYNQHSHITVDTYIVQN